jgi:hypothetical protein
MKGVSSLYGTRIAVDYVLENATVSTSLDALSTHLNFDDQPMDSVIQAHLIGWKHFVEKYKPNVTICVSPKEAIHNMRVRIRNDAYKLADDPHNNPDLDANLAELESFSGGLLTAMETVISQGVSSAPPTIYHRTADIILQYYRDLHGCGNFTYYLGLKTSESGKREGTVTATHERYEATLKEIEWTKEKLLSMQQQEAAITDAEEEDVNYKRAKYTAKWNILADYDPVLADLVRSWCGNCMWGGGMHCQERMNFMVESYKMSRFDAMSSIMKVENGKGSACRRSPESAHQSVRMGKKNTANT